jgi:N-dimethylarginine dimethylaminohydrolase
MSASLSEVGRLRTVALKHARDAFISAEAIAAEWRDLNFTAPPDRARALQEYDEFAACITELGARPLWLPRALGVGLDSIYVRDASIVTPRGLVLAAMGKPQRQGEPEAQAAAFRAGHLPIAGAILPPGRLEGGDVVWLDARTVAVGQGYRTNLDGIRQLQQIMDADVECLIVPLPHWRGASDVFHLMSIISPVDRDLAVVYSPLMPVPFRELLRERGYGFVEVPDEEFDTMGANVLAVAPRRCVMVDGSPQTRRRLEAAGAQVRAYRGLEISLKGGGGPTCLTRPILRDDVSAAG